MESMEPTLRIAAPADAAGIEALMKASAAGLFPAYYDEQAVASGIRYVAEPDPKLLADGTYFVLENEGEMVACGGWSRRARPYTGSGNSASDDRVLDPASEAAHVRAMFTRPDWTRRGLAGGSWPNANERRRLRATASSTCWRRSPASRSTSLSVSRHPEPNSRSH